MKNGCVAGGCPGPHSSSKSGKKQVLALALCTLRKLGSWASGCGCVSHAQCSYGTGAERPSDLPCGCRAQALGPFSAALPGTLVRSWIGSGAAGIATVPHTRLLRLQVTASPTVSQFSLSTMCFNSLCKEEDTMLRSVDPHHHLIANDVDSGKSLSTRTVRDSTMRNTTCPVKTERQNVCGAFLRLTCRISWLVVRDTCAYRLE